MPSSAFQTSALRSEEHTSELQSHSHLVCRLLLAKQNHSRCSSRGSPTGIGARVAFFRSPPTFRVFLRACHRGVLPRAFLGLLLACFFFKGQAPPGALAFSPSGPSPV